MAEHKLKLGVKFINGLKVLGRILGYVTEFEFPVFEKEQTGPAVDVAWFMEKGQKFPLFIFEVESTASNAMVYNPLKVLEKPNEIFEKPLFFFQIVLTQGQNSSRIEDLKRSYGSYNYRIYRLSMAEEGQLMKDILSQHRRISGELNIIALIEFLEGKRWIKIDVNDLIDYIRKLEYEISSGNFLKAVGLLSLKYDHLVDAYIAELNALVAATIDPSNYVNYESYIGNNFQIPIHLGLRAFSNKSMLEKAYCFEKYKIWQNNGDHLTMVGPYFGLSQDYDQFLIYGAGGYFALLIALFSDVPNSDYHLCDELDKIIEATHSNYRVFNYLWLMIMAYKTPNALVYFNKSIAFIKSLPYYSSQIAEMLPFITDEELLYEFQDTFDEFKEEHLLQQPNYIVDTQCLIQTAIAALCGVDPMEKTSLNIKTYLLNR